MCSLSATAAAELGVPGAAASARLRWKIKLFPGIQGGASSFLGEVSLRSVDPFFWLAGELLLFLSVGLGRLKEATTNLVRLLFLPLLVAVGDSAAVWIRWGFRLFGCPLLPSSSLIWMLQWFSLTELLVLYLDAIGGVPARGRTRSMNPTAEFSTRASLAAFQCLESDYRSGWARLVVRRVVCADRRPEELRIHVQRRKMTSRVLVVIFYFLRVLDVKEGCTVLPFF